MTDLVLRRVRPWGGAETDLVLRGGRIADAAAEPGAPAIDGGGAIALPGFVDAHAHIDKTLIGTPWHPHRAGPTVRERIANEHRVRAALGLSPAAQSRRLVDHMAARGTTHARTHVDIDPDLGLRHLEGVLETRDAACHLIDIQIVAFPQSGVMIRPGTLALLDRAVAEGAALVGGLDPIGIDRDPVGQLDGLFAIAERRGAGIHLHDPGELGAVTLEMIHARTKALGLKGRVAVSHAFCLGGVGPARLDRLTALLLDQDIAIMTHGPGDSPFPPIRHLTDAGVRLFTGSDGVRDAWGPLNTGDMLERAFLLAYRSNFRKDADLETVLRMATEGGAAVMGAEGYGLDSGCRADLVLVDAETLAEAVVTHAPRRLVVKAGRVVVERGALV